MGDKSGVRVRSESSIEIDFYYRGVRCRECIKLKPTPKNIAYCTKLKAHIEHEIGKGEFDYKKHFPDSVRVKLFSKLPGDSLTVQEYIESWLITEKSKIKHSTWVGYQKIVKYHLVPSFGKLQLTELRRKHLYTWTDEHPKMSAKRARNVLSPLRIALNAAVKRELLESNPFAEFTLDKRSAKSEDVDPFSAEERATILDALQGQARNLVEFALWTGLRTSELIGLDWASIDWIRGVVRITRTLTQGMDEPEEGTKTESGLREVKLLPPALHALTLQKAHTFLKGAEIFQHPKSGERWTGDKAIRESMWGPALKRCGVRYRKPYQTRHTYASMMLMAGENPLWVARQMGHKDPSLTLKRYARWISSDMPDAGNKAVAAWSQLGHSVAVGH